MENINFKSGNIIIYILVIILAVFVTYFNSLTLGFLALDDTSILDYVKSADISIKDLFFPASIGPYFRPLTVLTFLINFNMFMYNPAAFHLFNVIIHLVNSLLIYFLALEIMEKTESCQQIALISSLIFALHPLNSEAVLWVSARPDLLSCLFSLVSLVLLLKYVANIRIRTALCISVSYFCALLSKESAIMILPLTLVFLFVERKRVTSKGIYLMIGMLTITTACYFYLRNGMKFMDDDSLGKVILSSKYSNNLIINDLAACGFYIRKMLYPFPLNIAVTNISVLYNLFVLGIAVPMILFLYKKYKYIKLAILTIAVGLIPPIMALNSKFPWTPYAERYIYISMAGFSISLGFVLQHYTKKIPFIVILSTVLLISIPTIYRVAEWADPVEFWQSTVSKTPVFAPVRLMLAAEFINAKRYDEAEIQLADAKCVGLKRDIDRKAYEKFRSVLNKKRGLETSTSNTKYSCF